jgi:trans-aconitate 2-methyltransferase
MNDDRWDPKQYERFRDERARPFYDLLGLVEPAPGGRVVDLGCGTGELTRALHRHTRASETLGVDSSSQMLAKSGTFAGAGLHFAERDIVGFSEGGWDVLFSNAALQWVDGHPALFEWLRTLIVPGGQLAVQMPSNFDHPSHLLAADVARESPFREALDGWVRRPPVLTTLRYSELLHELGFRHVRVRLEVYGHELASTDDVVEWVRGTLLTDYERRLPAELWPEFLARYRERVVAGLGKHSPYVYHFKRIFLYGRT